MWLVWMGLLHVGGRAELVWIDTSMLGLGVSWPAGGRLVVRVCVVVFDFCLCMFVCHCEAATPKRFQEENPTEPCLKRSLFDASLSWWEMVHLARFWCWLVVLVLSCEVIAQASPSPVPCESWLFFDLSLHVKNVAKTDWAMLTWLWRLIVPIWLLISNCCA